MEIYYGTGKKRTAYYVFPKDYDKTQAIEETAKKRKYAKADLKIIPVWIKGEDLFLEPEKGAKEEIAVIRRVK